MNRRPTCPRSVPKVPQGRRVGANLGAGTWRPLSPGAVVDRLQQGVIEFLILGTALYRKPDAKGPMKLASEENQANLPMRCKGSHLEAPFGCNVRHVEPEHANLSILYVGFKADTTSYSAIFCHRFNRSCTDQLVVGKPFTALSRSLRGARISMPQLTQTAAPC